MSVSEKLSDDDARLAEALEEIVESLETGHDTMEARTYRREVVDVKALRQRHGMTQQEFADAFGIAIGTLRNWEQGRRSPEGPAHVLLQVIEKRPSVAASVLNSELPQEDSIEDLREAIAKRDLEIGSLNAEVSRLRRQKNRTGYALKSTSVKKRA